MPVPVEAPRSSVFYYLKTLLVGSIKELVSNPTRRPFVGKLQRHGAKPLDVDYRDNLIRKDTSYGGIRTEVFEAHHALIVDMLGKSIVDAYLGEGMKKEAIYRNYLEKSCELKPEIEPRVKTAWRLPW
jgi:hypothetical protein